MVGWKSSKDLVLQGVYVLESNKQTVSVLKRCLNKKDHVKNFVYPGTKYSMIFQNLIVGGVGIRTRVEKI